MRRKLGALRCASEYFDEAAENRHLPGFFLVALHSGSVTAISMLVELLWETHCRVDEASPDGGESAVAAATEDDVHKLLGKDWLGSWVQYVSIYHHHPPHLAITTKCMLIIIMMTKRMMVMNVLSSTLKMVIDGYHYNNDDQMNARGCVCMMMTKQNGENYAEDDDDDIRLPAQPPFYSRE